MKQKYSQILIRYRPQLVDEIDGSELLNLLISRNVLTRRQVKSITVRTVHHAAQLTRSLLVIIIILFVYCTSLTDCKLTLYKKY